MSYEGKCICLGVSSSFMLNLSGFFLTTVASWFTASCLGVPEYFFFRYLTCLGVVCLFFTLLACLGVYIFSFLASLGNKCSRYLVCLRVFKILI